MACGDEADSEARGLSPLTCLQVVLRVKVTFLSTSAKIETSICLEVEGPDLVSTCHGEDERITVYSYNIPGARKALCLRRLVAFFVKALLTSANHGQNLLGRDVNFANCVVL